MPSTTKMKVAAARGRLAELATASRVPDAVLRPHTTWIRPVEFVPEYLIPKPFDSRVLLDLGSCGGGGGYGGRAWPAKASTIERLR